MRWFKIIIKKKKKYLRTTPIKITTVTVNLHFLLHSPGLSTEPNRATFLSFIFEMLPYHTSGLQSLCRIGPVNIYSWSCRAVLTEGMWSGLIVQLRSLSAALATPQRILREGPKVSLAPRGDGARSHQTEGHFRLSSCLFPPQASASPSPETP